MSGMYNMLEITFSLTVFFGGAVVSIEQLGKRPPLLVIMFWAMFFVIIANSFQCFCEMSNERGRNMASGV